MSSVASSNRVVAPPCSRQDEASEADTKLAASDKLAAAETTGWTARQTVAALNAARELDAAARVAQLRLAAKPALRLLGVVAGRLAEAGSLRVLEGVRYGFGALASLATGWEQYEVSPTQTDAFRNLDAGLAGAVDFAFGMTMPLVAIADGVLNFALPKLAPDLKARAGGFISGNLATAVRGAIALAEGVTTGDYRASQAFSQAAAAGEYGLFFQAGTAAVRKASALAANSTLTAWLAPART